MRSRVMRGDVDLRRRGYAEAAKTIPTTFPPIESAYNNRLEFIKVIIMSETNDLYPGYWADKTPDKPAVIIAETGDVVTYAELDDAANRLSQVFAAAGLKPGDHIAFCMENRAEYLPIMWGAHYAGLYYTAISSRLTTEELGYIIEDSNSQAFLTSPYMADSLVGLEEVLDQVQIRLCVGGDLPGFKRYEDAIAAASGEPLADRLEGLPMLYSSGTTGRPKGVKPKMTDDPLGRGDGLTAMVRFLFGASDESTYISPAPLYHSAPLRYCTQFNRIGATIVVMNKFDAEGVLATIDKYKVTHSQWVPTMFVRMLKLEASIRDQYDLSSLTFAIHAAAPCPIAIKEKMLDWWGPIVSRILCRHGGKRILLCLAAGLGGAQGNRRQADFGRTPYRR